MVDAEAMRQELATLLKALARHGTASGSRRAELDEIAQPTGDGDAEALRKLSAYLGSAAHEAEEALAAHPLAAVGAAFTLGVAVGRMSRP
jgi:hypothetical protein